MELEKRSKPSAVELFAGAGGLGMAISNAGFEPLAILERDPYCCETLKENKQSGITPVSDWPDVEPIDVRNYDYSSLPDQDIDLLSGGPPCQPFSLGGKHKAHRDDRDMFPEVARAVRELKPKVVLVENVRGLVRPSFSTYFEYIQLQLRHPEVELRSEEDWESHLKRLEQHHTSGGEESYRVVWRVLNAADYGVPQKRERVFMVAFRNDLGIEWTFDEISKTHSLDALLYDQFITGEYWDRHQIKQPAETTLLNKTVVRRLDRLRSADVFGTDSKAWNTVRDALKGLPDPRDSNSRYWHNHVFNPGARKYPGHTGSPYDMPAKTLKAGDHGVPGGENMLAHANGKVRYFTVRESARLQCFPDEFLFHGSWTETMRQLGNAVPVRLGEVVVNSLRSRLLEQRTVPIEGESSLQPA